MPTVENSRNINSCCMPHLHCAILSLNFVASSLQLHAKQAEYLVKVAAVTLVPVSTTVSSGRPSIAISPISSISLYDAPSPSERDFSDWNVLTVMFEKTSVGKERGMGKGTYRAWPQKF